MYTTGWYLVFTKPKQEINAAQNLILQEFEVYYPLIRYNKRKRNIYQLITEPLFPRYIFIHLDVKKHNWSKIRSTRGCVSLVRFGDLPAKVPDTLIEHIKKVEAESQLKQNKDSIFKPGDRVRIVNGILANYEGIVECENSHERITLLLSIAEGYTRKVSLSVHQIKEVV